MIDDWEEQELLRILRSERNMERSVLIAELKAIRNGYIGELEAQIHDTRKVINNLFRVHKLETFGTDFYSGEQLHESLIAFDAETNLMIKEILERKGDNTPILSKWKKQELIHVLRCERSEERNMIVAELVIIRDELVADLEELIRTAQDTIAVRLKEHKLETFGATSHGAIQLHDRLIEFDSETNRLIREILERTTDTEKGDDIDVE